MSDFSDQDLSAFIDGELSEARSQALADALEVDADLAARLERLSRANDEFRSAHVDLTEAPIPQPLLDILDRAAPAADTPSNVHAFPTRLARARAWILPLAACLVLAIGIGLGTRMNTGSAPTTPTQVYAGPVAADSLLHDVLETTPSAQTEAGLTPALTYTAQDGGYCREVESAEARMLACRKAQRGWTVLAVVATGNASSDDGYRLASGGTTAVFDALAEDMMADAPLSKQDEQALLNQGWGE